MSATLTAAYRQIIERDFGRDFGPGDVTHVINTHHHSDHVNGNQVFAGAQIIAHANAPARMREEDDAQAIEAYVKHTRARLGTYARIMAGLDTGSVLYRRFRDRVLALTAMCDDYESGYRLTLPTTTVKDTLTLDMGDVTIEILAFGPGFHSDTDLIVSLPEEGIVFTGDLVRPFDQFFRVTSTSDIAPWIATLDRIAQSNPAVDQVVAWHSGMLPGTVLGELRRTLAAMLRDREGQENAVDRLREQLATLPVAEAVAGFAARDGDKDGNGNGNGNGEGSRYLLEGDLLALAGEYEAAGRADDALALLALAVERFPASTRGLFRQAGIFTAQGRRDRAIELYEEMRRIDPGNFYYVELIYGLQAGN